MLNNINISHDRQKLIVYVVLTIITLAVFWQVNQYNFVNLDDYVYVTENIHVQSGITLDGFRLAFSTTYCEFWHPLTWISLMFDYQLYGLNAGGYHLTNLILHVMSTLLLFWLFNRMTGAIWRSAFIAAIFAIHPLHVESVAWIAERKDVLSAFFWMLTLCLYVYYTEKPVIRRYLLVLFSFACGLMSKPMVVTLPIVMIILDYWPLDRIQSQKKGNISPPHDQKLSETKIMGIIPLWQLLEKIPFFILSTVFSIITLYIRYNPSIQKSPLGARIAKASVSFVTYLEKIFWPHDLAVIYSFSDQLPVWQVMGAALLILVISAAVIVTVKRLPYLFVGWLWYAVTILPVIGIIPFSFNAMADRYTYLPLIGIGIMLAWGTPLLFQHADIRKKILFPAGIIFLTIMAFVSWNQCGYWKNSATLCSHALQVTKDNYIVHTCLGIAMFEEGKIEEARDHYNKAISIAPYAPAYINRGIIYINRGQYQMAIEDFTKAIRNAVLIAPLVEAYNNRGLIYTKLSQYQLAIEDLNEAIRLKPNHAEAYNNRGIIYGTQGQYQMAIEDFTKAIRLKKNYAVAYNNRRHVYNLVCLDAQKACELGNCKLLELAKSKGKCP